MGSTIISNYFLQGRKVAAIMLCRDLDYSSMVEQIGVKNQSGSLVRIQASPLDFLIFKVFCNEAGRSQAQS